MADSATKTECLHRHDYHDKFSPVAYLRSYWGNIEPWNQFLLECTYEFMRHEAVSGSRLLDLGCGANVAGVLAAADHFNNIVMADFSQSNLDVLKRWSRGEDIGFSWDDICQHYIQTFGLESEWKDERLRTLKTSIKDITTCDVLQQEPLGPGYSGHFDCVFTSFCLEGAAADYPTFCQSLKNVASLLREDGCLVMRGSLGESSYPVDDKDFHTLALTVSQVLTSQYEAGFKVISCKLDELGEVDIDKIEHYPETKSCFCLLSQKSTS